MEDGNESKFLQNENRWWKLHENLRDSISDIIKADENNLEYFQSLKIQPKKQSKVTIQNKNVNKLEMALEESENDILCLDQAVENYLDEIKKYGEKNAKEREELMNTFHWAEKDHVKRFDEITYMVQKCMDKRKLAKESNMRHIANIQESFNELHDKTLTLIKLASNWKGSDKQET